MSEYFFRFGIYWEDISGEFIFYNIVQNSIPDLLRVFRGTNNSYGSGIEKNVDHFKMILEYGNYGKAGKLQMRNFIFIRADPCEKINPKNKRASICRKAIVECAFNI